MTKNYIKNTIPKLRFPEFSEEWKSRHLSDFLIYTPREIFKPKDYYLSIGIRSHFKGTFQRRDADPSKIEMEKLYIVKEKDLIVNITFAWEGAIAIATKEDDGGLVSHRFPTYTFNNKVVLSNFFQYLFPRKRFKYELALASPGGAGRNRVLNKKTFLEISVFIPSLEEQKETADFLSLIDNKINILTKKVELLKKYKKGVMQKIFSQEIRFKDENGNEYTKWTNIPLNYIGSTYNGLVGKNSDDFGEGSFYITYKQIFDNTTIDPNKFGKVKISTNENQNSVQFGDIFFTASSETPDEVGYVSVLLDHIDNLYLNSFCFGYRINRNDLFIPKFAKFIFNSSLFRKKIIRLAQGSTRYNLAKTELLKITVDLPCIEEQKKIADFLTKIDDKIELEERKLEQVKLFKKSLLQQMFV